MGAPPVTLAFVVPVRNDPDRLERCLRSITAAVGGAAVRIVVADNGSTDDTPARAAAAGATVLSLPGLRVGALRNAAALGCEEDLVAFADADHELDPGWVRAALDVMQDAGVGGAGAAYEPPSPGTWVQQAYGALRGRTRGSHPAEWLGAGNLVVRRTAFTEAGGFDTSLEACEDVDLCNRLRLAGWRLVADERLRSIHHGDPATLGRVFKSELWRGRDNIRVTLRGPLTWRAWPSILFPLVLLFSLVALLISPFAWSLGGAWLAALAVLAIATIVGQRALRIWMAWRSRPGGLNGVRKSAALAAAYELPRALALLWRAPHHRAKGTARG